MEIGNITKVKEDVIIKTTNKKEKRILQKSRMYKNERLFCILNKSPNGDFKFISLVLNYYWDILLYIQGT
ncbi:hypothetical protein PWK10_06870 [Caloramator sp. Dgby_cultured_2]|uniref:hypothetical protein n=1 Tax=Caloramator sp. Dgby_cultured_2 TaxID=3029174 RepID=UPI00237EC661|nr:hypothetical protein [Caloramator sp. Dgby_cultured_2]WDU84104.1 hypothetical protein PWK10_06870 [Caloramator sp. Dgby_cultured_2]